MRFPRELSARLANNYPSPKLFPISVQVNGDMHKRFQAFCKREGISISEAVAILIMETIDAGGENG